MRRRLVLVAGAILALSACATPETRLRNGLYQAGLSQPVSACMADRMIDRLSLVQLRRISALEGVKGKRIGDMPVDDFLYKVRALRDPEIMAVSTTSAAICAVRTL